MITVLEDYGVLVGICGRHRHIRMYGLEAIQEKQTKKGKKKDAFIKIRETKYCAHYSIIRTKGTVFMVAAIKRQIILFMWADYPFNKFMKIKDFYVPEMASRVEPILTNGKISQVAIQVSSRFLIIDVDTNFPSEIPFPLTKKLVPLLIHKSEDGRLLITYNSKCLLCLLLVFLLQFVCVSNIPLLWCLVEGGHLLDPTTLEPVGKFLSWRFIPAAVGE